MNNALTNEQINNIRNNVDIVEVISSYIPLTPKGKNFFGVCPFHSDQHPSMSVSKEKQIYTCFSCGASGNVYNFLMDYEHISFIDAVKKCADLAGIPLNISGKQITNKNSPLYEIYSLSLKYYQNNLNTEAGKEAKEYLKKRHFDSKMIKEFNIGLALNKKDDLTNLLLKKEYGTRVLEKTGLIGKNSQGYYDLYVNRIMFPLYDLNGKVVGYSGRIYNESNTNKYVNTMETEIFKKGELLYNYHVAKETHANEIIVVEGFMDVIRLSTIGIRNVVATMGTAITKNQALLMKRLSNNIILMFDGDEAGDKATNSCIRELERVGIIPKVVRLENNLDPDEYILEYGKNKMLEKLSNPINSMDYKMNYYKKGKNLKNEFEMTEYINDTLNELSNIDNDIYVELTLKKLSDESGLSVEYLKSKVNKKEEKVIIKEDNQKLTGYEKAERNLTYYMLNNPDVVKLVITNKPMFLNNDYKKLANKVIAYYNTHHTVSLADILTYLRDDETLETLKRIMVLNLKEVDLKVINGYVERLKTRKNQKNIASLNKELIKNIDQNEKLKKLQEMIELKKEDDTYGK